MQGEFRSEFRSDFGTHLVAETDFGIHTDAKPDSGTRFTTQFRNRHTSGIHAPIHSELHTDMQNEWLSLTCHDVSYLRYLYTYI